MEVSFYKTQFSPQIGVIGLVEEEWMSTLSTVDFDELKYESFLIAGKKLARQLRNEDVIEITNLA